MNEATLEANEVTYLKSRGAWVAPKTWRSPAQKRGTPDRLVCFQGHFVSFEFKHPSLNVRGATSDNDRFARPAQRDQLAAIRKAGGTAYVVNSHEQVVFILNQLEGL